MIIFRVNTKVNQWKDDLVLSTLQTDIFLPKDYNPPKYSNPSLHNEVSETNVTTSISSWEFSSKSFLSNLSTSYDILINSSTHIFNSTPSYYSNETTLDINFLKDMFTYTFDYFDHSILSQYGIEFESLSTPDSITIASWFTPLLNLSSQIILFDIIWRIIQSFRYLYKHWKGTIIKIQPVDLRLSSSHELITRWITPLINIMSGISHLSFYIFMILLGLGLILWTFSGNHLIFLIIVFFL